MATVVITITDEEPDHDLTVGMEFRPAISKTDNFEEFEKAHPITHTAAYLAFAAIDQYAGGDASVSASFETGTGPIVI